MGCKGEEELSLLQSRVPKRILSNAWCQKNSHKRKGATMIESPSSPNADQMDLFQQLLETAEAAMEANQGVSPAYNNLTVGPEGFMCACVKAVYNTVYPPPAQPGAKFPPAPDHFQQADRDSCNLAAEAEALSIKKPQVMINFLADLYFKGEISSVTPPVKPRQYVLDMNPADDANCKDEECQTGPIFVWSSALRDARNQQIMATLAQQGVQIPVKDTMITVTPIEGGGTQGGNGASYYATPDDTDYWLKLLGIPAGNWIQGACKDDRCKDLLQNQLPAEQVALFAWYTSATKAWATGQAPPAYTGPFENVKNLTEMEDVQTLIGLYFTPVSESQLVSNTPAILGINAVGLQSGWCEGEFVDGEHGAEQLSMCPTQEMLDGSSCPKPGESPCALDHNVVLEGCNDGICDVWSWAFRYKVRAASLAAQTMTVQSF
jgi:hypothetical protein